MKDNYTIVKEDYNENTFETVIVITTPIGAFEGRTVADEIDKEIPSAFHGNEIALCKALKKYAKAMVVILRESYKTLENMRKQYGDSKYSNLGGHEAKLLYRALDAKKAELELWKQRVKTLGKVNIERVKARDKIIEKYINKEYKGQI